jgi:hypothetical protein
MARKSTSSEVLESFRENVGDSADHITEAQNSALLNYAFLDNELWNKDDLAAAQQRGFPTVYVNRLVHLLGSIAGREIMSRYRPKVLGRGRSRRGSGEQLDELVRWVRQGVDMPTLDSFVFWNSLAAGIAASHTYVVHSLDTPKVFCEWQPITQCAWDHCAVHPNLADRKWGAVVKWVHHDELMRRFGALPGVADLAKRAKRNNGAAVNGMGWTWTDIRDGRWMMHGVREILLAEYEWREDERVTYVITPVAAQDLVDVANGAAPGITLVTGARIAAEQLRAAFQQGYPPEQLEQALVNTPMRVEVDDVRAWVERTRRGVMDVQMSQRELVRYGLIAGDEVIHVGERPAFQLQFLTCLPVPHRNGVKWRGLLDYARGIQDVMTRTISAGLHQVGTQPRAGLIVEEDAVEDKDAFVDQLGSSDQVAWVRPGAAQGQKILPVPRVSGPEWSPWLQFAQQAVLDSMGVTNVDVGAVPDPRRVSSRALNQIREASSSTLSRPFDHLRLYRRDHTHMLLSLLPDHFTLGELGEVLEDADQPLPPLDEWPNLRHFDVVVDEVPVSPTELMELFNVLTDTNLLEPLMARGILTETWVINRLPHLTESDRRELMADFQARMEAAQAEAAPPPPEEAATAPAAGA